ncbi:hypothetical protein [Kitasatospora purpeofusca]|uniref:hypothetical protein n=1 Tax=Kitasatospora purpeofusca TaxID=67352 RepID=UPI00368E9AB0
MSVHDGVMYRVEARIRYRSGREEIRTRDVEGDDAFRIPRIVSGFKAAGAVEVTVTRRVYLESPEPGLSWMGER